MQSEFISRTLKLETLVFKMWMVFHVKSSNTFYLAKQKGFNLVHGSDRINFATFSCMDPEKC